MKTLFHFLFVGVLITGIINGDRNVTFHDFKLCYTPKHCIKCTNHNIGIGRFYTAPDQETYMKSLIDQFNDFRSWYAKEFEIGNMRFVKFNFDLYSLANDTASMVGNAELSCTTLNSSARIRVHSLADFSSSLKSVIDINSTNHVMFQNQFKALTNQAINSTHLVKYNVNEFGCSYSFRPLSTRTVFLLRCVFYVDNDLDEGEILSLVPCLNCTTMETCILSKYPGLCVPINSTEKYVKKLLLPDNESFSSASVFSYIKLYLFVTTILVIMCEMLLINKI